MPNTWIVTTDPKIDALVDAGQKLGQPITVIAVGNGTRYAGVDAVKQIHLADNVPAEAASPAVLEAVDVVPGDVILVPNKSAERVLAGAIAAKLNLPVLTNTRLGADGSFEVSRFGGIATELIKTEKAVIVLMDAASTVSGDEVAPSELPTSGPLPATITGEDASDVAEVNLASAKKIIAVGRGIKAKEDLTMVEALAARIGAELACSRPIAEGVEWMPRNTYIGVSGEKVAPNLYVAAGISGQIQHTSGAQGAKNIVVINSDANAPYFKDADYGIVGDLYDIIPALTEALA